MYCLCKLKLVWMPVKVSKLYLEVNNLYNKRIFLYFCIILILFTCSGCAFFPDGSRYSGEQVTAEVVTENDNVTGKLGDNILVNADLKIPDVAVWNTYNASAKIYDEEKFINFLSDVNGMDIKDRREENKYYKFSDGSSVSFSSECLRYETVKSGEKHYNSLVSEYYGLAFDISDRFPLNELEGFSKEECIKTAGQVVETLGVETYGEPVIITMDADSSNRFLNTEGNEYLKYTNLKSEEGDGTWTKDDEVYFVEYQLSIDNIPISLQKVSSSTSSFAGSFIDIVIGKNGIMYIEGRGVNQYDGAQRIEGSLIDVIQMYTSGVCPAAIRAFNFPSYSSRFVVIGVTWYFPSYSVLKRSITSLYPLETKSSVASRSSQNIHVISSVSSAYAGTATAMVPATIAAESNTESNLFLFIFLILLLIYYLVS